MKKIFAILMSLLFLVSVFGITSAFALSNDYQVTATPDTVKVGELITLTTNFPSSLDPDIIADGNLPKGDAVLVSRPPERVSGKGLTPVETYTWVYRATEPGTIIFDFGAKDLVPNGHNAVSNSVKIIASSYPMNSFMKILGFGNESA